MEEPDWIRLGQRVAARREELDLSQGEIADRAKVSDSTWWKIEAGIRVGARTRRLASRALGWSPESATDIANGGEPTLTAPSADQPTPVTAAIRDDPGLTPEDRETLLHVYRLARRRGPT